MIDTTELLTENIHLADWTRALKPSALQESLMIASKPGIISLALGLPALEFFPKKAYAQAVERVLESDPRALQYGPPSESLKAQIADLMALRGVACKKEQVFLTAGAQQGMNLLSRLMLDRGGEVLMEEMAYTGFQQVIEPFQPNLLTVSTDLGTGIDVDAVEALLAGGARPAFIYVVTEGHNPLAVSMSAEKRVRLVELAREYHVPIMEDDAYGFLCYDSHSVPPMRSIEDQWVFYVGSFSKTLAPGLRVGWIIVPEWLITKLSVIKEATDINTSTFTQKTVSAYIDQGSFNDHIAFLRSEYKARRDAMLSALEDYYPAGVRWRVPSSGVFIWVELPDGTDTATLLRLAVEQEHVAFIPGNAFCADGSSKGGNCIRLNFSHSNGELIRKGILRLARVLKDVLA
jgi:2-aminoadipate transaminase